MQRRSKVTCRGNGVFFGLLHCRRPGSRMSSMSSPDWSQSPARGPRAAARTAPVKGEWGNSEEGFWEEEATGHVYLGQVGAPEGPGTERSARKPRGTRVRTER